MRRQKRVLICSLVALVSGLSSAYIGSQISLKVYTQKCQSQPWGLKTLCNAWVAPGAIWQGGTMGLCLGIVGGGVSAWWAIGKSETRNKSVTASAEFDSNLAAISLFAHELELTDAERQVLRRFLGLLTVLAVSTPSEAQSQLSLDELQRLLELARKLGAQDISWEQVCQLLQLKVDAQINTHHKTSQADLADNLSCLRRFIADDF